MELVVERLTSGASGAGEGRRRTAGELDMAGVIVCGVRDGRIRWARLHLKRSTTVARGSTPPCGACPAWTTMPSRISPTSGASTKRSPPGPIRITYSSMSNVVRMRRVASSH